MSDASNQVFLFVFAIIILIVYFIPAAIAQRRNHKNKTAIYALNIVAGWTFIGWVVALVWGLTGTSGSNQP